MAGVLLSVVAHPVRLVCACVCVSVCMYVSPLMRLDDGCAWFIPCSHSNYRRCATYFLGSGSMTSFYKVANGLVECKLWIGNITHTTSEFCTAVTETQNRMEQNTLLFSGSFRKNFDLGLEYLNGDFWGLGQGTIWPQGERTEK